MKITVNQNGFTYMAVLMVVVIMGIMLGMIGQSWKTAKQRELEDEALFRADQVMELIYQRLLCKNANLSQNTVNQFLWTVDSPRGTILDDLIAGKEERCMNGTTRQFRLRASAALDPFSNKQWHIIKPVGDETHFLGVASESSEEPFRKSLQSIYNTKQLDEKKKYSDWLFTWDVKQMQNLPQQQNQNVNQNVNQTK